MVRNAQLKINISLTMQKSNMREKCTAENLVVSRYSPEIL